MFLNQRLDEVKKKKVDLEELEETSEDVLLFLLLH